MRDYKQTIFLPTTSFPMKGELPKKEPEILARWEKMNLYEKLRQKSHGREKFILHEGPPYANGNLHIGHAFTGIFKDIVIRFQQMLGKDAPLVPGWDCHGLPIEWKIEEKYRQQGKKKEEIPRKIFRQECRDFAAHWIEVQKKQAQRWGRLGNWEKPYITMDYEVEASITAEFFTFLEKGYVYRGHRPILWSVIEQTALAEAEVEYKEITSKSLYVRFPIQKGSLDLLKDVNVVIWTTTGWTLPANQAICYGPQITYVVIEVLQKTEASLGRLGEKLLIAQDLLAPFCQTTGITDYKIQGTVLGKDLQGTLCHHCLHGQGYEHDVPLLPGEHVTTESGTGLVHTAPSHGPDDFEVGKKFSLNMPQLVQADGHYEATVPLFGGLHIFKAGETIQEALLKNETLVYAGSLQHSYPHSWRSKKPLIYRLTSQWFISLEHNNLRKRALEEIKKVSWFPPQAQSRLYAMVADRPDWCISRQRAWGVPLSLFIHKKTKEPLIDSKVNQRILEAIRQEGCDAWFESDASRFLAPDYSAEDYEKTYDILDVWFDSGSTQGFVLEKRPELQNPATLYLEGSDQHRGWFQSSLLVGCGTRGRAPYQNVLTHGFALDEQGRKMSKSLGNVVDPEDIIKNGGADLLRLWVVGCDYRDDMRIGTDILKHQQDIYRRFRNTFRYLLGALAGFTEKEKMEENALPDLEKWVLHRLSLLDSLLKKCVETYDFLQFFNALHSFCAVELSAFYFDIRKDVLYCDDSQGLKRRAVRTVMDHLFQCLVHWVAPVLCFTAEEAWLARFGEDPESSIHLQDFPLLPAHWHRPDLGEKYEEIRLQRRVMTGALEKARAEGLIGSSLQAYLVVYDPQKRLDPSVPFEELAIVSSLELRQEALPADAFVLPEYPDIGAKVQMAQGEKCQRCWKILEEVGSNPERPDLCNRCASVVERFPASSQENKENSQ